MLRAIWEFMQTLAWWHLGALCALPFVMMALIACFLVFAFGFEKVKQWLNKK